MLESHNSYSAKFSTKQAQVSWFKSIEDAVTVSDISMLCSCSERTVRDWRRGRFMPQYDCVKNIVTAHGLSLPKVEKVSRTAHLSRAGKKGGDATVQNHGKPLVSESFRLHAWRSWWDTTGRHLSTISNTPLKIRKPKKSAELAEFMGIMIGDGGMSTYHIAITLNATDDAQYIEFVTNLVERLFGVRPKILKRKDKNAVAITVARKLLVEYLTTLGLPIGNKVKQNITVPSWIMKNHDYARACMRGLIDTDGSIFTHKYVSKRKVYAYKKISFSSASPTLLRAVHTILTQNGVEANVAKTNVRIDSRASVTKFFSCIGTSNPKHLKRLCG